MALLDIDKTKYTSVVLLVDKEEIEVLVQQECIQNSLRNTVAEIMDRARRIF